MKFFAAVKLAQFATSLFAKAGLNLDTLHAAADENALKAHIEQAVAAAPAKPNAEHEQLVAEAVAENLRLTADLALAKKTLGEVTEGRAAVAAILEPLSATLVASVIKLDACNDDKGAFSADKFKAALTTRISTKASELVAATGGPLLDETPAADATKAAAKTLDPKLTGLARAIAANRLSAASN